MVGCERERERENNDDVMRSNESLSHSSIFWPKNLTVLNLSLQKFHFHRCPHKKSGH